MMHRSLRAAAVALVLAAAASAPAFAADDKDPVVAVVNGVEIHKSAVYDYYKNSQFAQVPFDAVFPQMLDIAVTSQLVLEQAEKQNLASDPEVKKQAALALQSFERQAWMNRKVETAISEDAIKARYATLKPREEIHARHILLKTEDEAKKVIAELKKGAKFEEVAKAKTQDPSGKGNGGDLDFFAADEMVPEFSSVAFKLKDGEVTQTPVQTQFGWHVIKVEAHRTQPVPSYDELKPSIAGELKQKALRDILEQLRKTATVKRFNVDGTPAADKPADAPAKQ